MCRNFCGTRMCFHFILRILFLNKIYNLEKRRPKISPWTQSKTCKISCLTWVGWSGLSLKAEFWLRRSSKEEAWSFVVEVGKRSAAAEEHDGSMYTQATLSNEPPDLLIYKDIVFCWHPLCLYPGLCPHGLRRLLNGDFFPQKWASFHAIFIKDRVARFWFSLSCVL